MNSSCLQFGLIILIFLTLTTGCNEDMESPNLELSALSFIQNVDSIHRYAEQIYLWNDQLHPKDQATIYQRYAHNNILRDYRDVLWELLQAAKNPETGQPYEYNFRDPGSPKYSTVFSENADFSTASDQSTTVTLENNFGLALYINGENVYVLYVDINSPAGRMAIKRGDRILQINDTTVNSTSYLHLWQNAIRQSFAKLQVQSPSGGDLREVRLGADQFIPNPLLSHKIFQQNSKTVGYLSYLTFSEESNTRTAIEPVLRNFAAKGVSELIIDLRYNGGGYQNTVNYLANQICASNNPTKVMYSEHYNLLMQARKAHILKNQILRNSDGSPYYIDGRKASLYDIDFSVEANTHYFQDDGILNNITKVYFIVSEYTASASELLINSIKPYLDVELIGVSLQNNSTVKTYGKPLGFFDISIGDLLLYMPLYQTKNALNEGGYFQGMTCKYSTVDDPSYDFGSFNDNAISFILQGEGSKISTSKSRRLSSTQSSEAGNYLFNGNAETKLTRDFHLIRFKD